MSFSIPKAVIRNVNGFVWQNFVGGVYFLGYDVTIVGSYQTSPLSFLYENKPTII